jgi:hypothetical protein
VSTVEKVIKKGMLVFDKLNRCGPVKDDPAG